MADIPEYKAPKSDAAPKGPGAPKGTTGKSKARNNRPKPKPTMPVDEIRSELTEFMVGIGMLTMMKNENDGLILIGGSLDVVDAWCDLAEKNPYVHIVLQKFCEGGDAAKVISTTVPLALALAANHGIYKGPLPVPPVKYAEKAASIMEDLQTRQFNEDDAGSSEPSAASNGTGLSAVS